MQSELLTVDEVANILKLSKNAVYVLIHRRQIPVVKIGRRVRFSASEIEEWIQQQARGIKDNKSGE